MQTKELQQIAINALNDLKGIDVITFDVHTITTITDVMIICTGRSTRHVSALAENVMTQAKQHHVKHIHHEGKSEGEWVVVDLGDVIVHVMLPATREFYNLEDLWEPIKQMREHQG